MQAGRLDKRIRLERPVRVISPDGSWSSSQDTWELVAEVWASVRSPTARERFQAPKALPVEVASIWIRHREVEPSWRVVWEGRVYQIVGLAPIGRREGVEIAVERIKA